MSVRAKLTRAKLLAILPFALYVICVAMNGYNALRAGPIVLRVFSFVIAIAFASWAAFMLGRRSAFSTYERTYERAFAPLPKSISISENEQGTKVALVEQNSGDVVSIELPDEIDNADDATRYIIEQLTSDES